MLRAVIAAYPAEFRLPVWDPSVAASAGASFAGLLGALLLAVTFQIAADKKPDNKLRIGSLAAAPISLLLVLTAAYLYVVLSGTTVISKPLASECAAGHASACIYLGVPAAMFAIAGSYLGLGAISLGFTLRLLAGERSAAESSKNATTIFFCGGSAISITSLLWGYRDATTVLSRHNITLNSYLVHRWGLLVGLSGLAIGMACAEYARVLSDKNGFWKIVRWPIGVLIIAYFVSPVIWYLNVETTPLGHEPLWSGWMTQIMLGWVAFGFGGCADWLRTNSRDEKRNQTEKPRSKLRAYGH